MKNRVSDRTTEPEQLTPPQKAKRGPRGPYKNYNPKSLENLKWRRPKPPPAPTVPPEPAAPTTPPVVEVPRSLEERARAADYEKPVSPPPLRQPPPGTSMSRRPVMPYDPRDDKPVVGRSIFDRKDTPAWEGYGPPKRRPYKP